MLTIVVIIFVLGYLAVVFEAPLKLDKTVPVLLMAGLCWAAISIGDLPLFDHHMNLINLTGTDHDKMMQPVLLGHIGKIAEILIFLIGAMVIVELVDLHNGFSVITDRITATKKSSMLWLVCFLTFFLSAVLDNLTCTIVIISLLKRLVPVKEERIYFSCLTIIAANAGGAWSPIGDVTTTMLWIDEKISTQGLILSMFLPSLVCVVVPTFLMSRMSYMKGLITIPEGLEMDNTKYKKTVAGSSIMLYVGLGALLFVPIFKNITHLPPYIGIMMGMGVLWLVSEFVHPDEEFEDKHKYSARYALSRIEMSSVLFFLGILMGVAALESLGILKNLAGTLDGVFAIENATGGLDRSIVMVLLGFASAVIDNVPLVAAAMGMYTAPMDDSIWLFLAYTAGTGGSMLIIGSAAGVAAMGIEKIEFMWYLKHIAGITALGFLAGCAVYMLTYPLIVGWMPVH